MDNRTRKYTIEVVARMMILSERSQEGPAPIVEFPVIPRLANPEEYDCLPEDYYDKMVH